MEAGAGGNEKGEEFMAKGPLFELIGTIDDMPPDAVKLNATECVLAILPFDIAASGELMSLAFPDPRVPKEALVTPVPVAAPSELIEISAF